MRYTSTRGIEMTAMDQVREFYDKHRTVRYRKGEIILLQNEAPTTAFAVKSGVVRSYTITSSYAERSISFSTQDEIFPVYWLFSKSDTTLFYYVAHTDCELYVLNRETFQQKVKQSALISYMLLTRSVEEYAIKELQVASLEQLRAIDRILYTMSYLCTHYGSQITSDTMRISIPLTQKDIASFAGLARETVAAEMSKVRHENIISRRGKFYTVNLVNLHKLIDDS